MSVLTIFISVYYLQCRWSVKQTKLKHYLLLKASICIGIVPGIFTLKFSSEATDYWWWNSLVIIHVEDIHYLPIDKSIYGS